MVLTIGALLYVLGISSLWMILEYIIIVRYNDLNFEIKISQPISMMYFMRIPRIIIYYSSSSYFGLINIDIYFCIVIHYNNFSSIL